MSSTGQSLITNPEENQKVDDRVFFSLQEKVGSMGKYQKVTVALWCLVGYLTGGLMLITPYLFYQDPYYCGDGYSNKQCLQTVCKFENVADREIYIPKNPTMISLANEFGDFRCDDQKLKLDFIITLMYVGNVVGFLGLTLVGDLFGRKTLMLGNLAICAVGMIITAFCANLTMAGIGLFISTCGIQNAFNICFYYISETVSQQYRQKFSVAIQLFYGLGVLINVLWFFAVGNWKIILIVFYLIPLAFVIAGTIFIVKDTPICLVMRYPSAQAVKDFHFIAKMNKKDDFQLTINQVTKLKHSYSVKLAGENNKAKKAFTILDLFKFKSLRLTTLLCILLQCTIIFQFYAPALMLDQFQLNIFINGLVIGVSEIIAYPLCFYMITRIKRRHVAYGCFLLTFICSFILTFVWKQGSDQTPDIGSSIGVLALIFFFRFAISVQYTYFYVYYNELYPTQVRVLGTGLVSTMGGVMVTVAPQILDTCISKGFPVMVLFVVLSGLSGLLSSRLPETLQKTPPDEIEELRKSNIQAERSESNITSDSLIKIKTAKTKSTEYSASDELEEQEIGVN